MLDFERSATLPDRSPGRVALPIIDPRSKILKANPTVTVDVLRNYRFEMLEIYHSISDRLLNPTLPTLVNTDGDPLAFCRVIYEVPSPMAAFEALRHLSLGHTDAELLADASFDQAGELVSVELTWLKAGNARMDWKMTSLATSRSRVAA